MSRCKASMRIRATTESPEIELACDLDENHTHLLTFHFDRSIGQKGIEWRYPLEPTGVPATRTTPPSSLKAKGAKRAALSSVSAHTQAFDILELQDA